MVNTDTDVANKFKVLFDDHRDVFSAFDTPHFAIASDNYGYENVNRCTITRDMIYHNTSINCESCRIVTEVIPCIANRTFVSVSVGPSYQYYVHKNKVRVDGSDAEEWVSIVDNAGDKYKTLILIKKRRG